MHFIESTFLSGVRATVGKRRTARKLLTREQLMLYSKYFKSETEKKLNQSSLKIYLIYLLNATCRIYIWKPKLSGASTNYSNLCTQVYGWNSIKQKWHRNWLCSTPVLSSGGRKSLFSPENPVVSCQGHSLSSNSGMNDREVDNNRNQSIKLETFLFKHFSIMSCLTKAADRQKRPPVYRVNTSLIKGMKITVSKRLSHRPNLY